MVSFIDFHGEFVLLDVNTLKKKTLVFYDVFVSRKIENVPHFCPSPLDYREKLAVSNQVCPQACLWSSSSTSKLQRLLIVYKTLAKGKL